MTGVRQDHDCGNGLRSFAGKPCMYTLTDPNHPIDYCPSFPELVVINNFTLREVACSVLLVPEKFDFPKSIILAYDGSEDAVFAIKQFAYLFPELAKRQTVLVYASEDRNEDFPDKILLEEFAARHFKDLTLTKLDLDPKKYFSTWMLEKESAMLVSGSYGRSGISQLFKKSFVKDIIADHRLPVFIAHQ